MKSPIKFITEVLTKNIALKIISLLIAFFIWVMVVSEKKSEIGFSTSIQYQNIPKNMEIVGNPVQNLEVNVRGHRRDISRLSLRQIKAIVNLGRDKEGKNIHFMANENIEVGRDVEIVQVNPYKIDVFLEKSITKKVRIMPVILGKPQDGFRMEQTTILPEFTTIVGPRSEVKKVSYVRTTPFDFTGMDKTFSKRLPLALENANVRLVDKTAPKITLTISEIFDHKIFKANTVLNETGFDIRINPTKIDVVLRGPQRSLNAIKEKDIKVFLSGKQISRDTTGTISIIPEYKLPEKVKLEEMIPPNISCTVLTYKKKADVHNDKKADKKGVKSSTKAKKRSAHGKKKKNTKKKNNIKNEEKNNAAKRGKAD